MARWREAEASDVATLRAAMDKPGVPQDVLAQYRGFVPGACVHLVSFALARAEPGLATALIAFQRRMRSRQGGAGKRAAGVVDPHGSRPWRVCQTDPDVPGHFEAVTPPALRHVPFPVVLM
jgi:hypothetical protein